MIFNSFRSYLYEMTARDAIADIKKLKDISKLSRSQAQQKCPEVLKFYNPHKTPHLYGVGIKAIKK